MIYTTAEPVLMDPDCLQQWRSHINDTTWHITTACKAESPQTIYPATVLVIIWAVLTFLFLWSSLMFFLSKIDTISRLRRIPSYELHETVEAMHEKYLYTTAKKEAYKAKWKGRYISVDYSEDRNGHGGKRTITIVEDLIKVPQTVSLGMSQIAVAGVGASPLTYRPREALRNVPTRPAAVASAGQTRSAAAFHSVSSQPPPPYTW